MLLLFKNNIIFVTLVTKEYIMEKQSEYIFVTYNVPSEPSRIRVYVWRLLKKLGALNIQQSLWILPDDDVILKALDKVKDSIEKDGGCIYIVRGQFIYAGVDIVQKFIDERNSEYNEVLDYCQKFHDEMRIETQQNNFTFAELEENDEEYNKLCHWYEKIKARDYFNATMGETVIEQIKKCKIEFDKFTSRVYESNSKE